MFESLVLYLLSVVQISWERRAGAR